MFYLNLFFSKLILFFRKIEEAKEVEKFARKFQHFEEEIEIRVESLKIRLDLLKNKICKNIEKTKLNCKESLKQMRKNETCVDDIFKWEYYGCFIKLKMRLNYPIRKDLGYVKSLPSGVPGTNCRWLYIITFLKLNI